DDNTDNPDDGRLGWGDAALIGAADATPHDGAAPAEPQELQGQIGDPDETEHNSANAHEARDSGGHDQPGMPGDGPAETGDGDAHDANDGASHERQDAAADNDPDDNNPHDPDNNDPDDNNGGPDAGEHQGANAHEGRHGPGPDH